ncbi:hypothetical protein GE061_015998 [Apolygus lucorum]|uniref:Uncharacterized protein n=1 Tax=Apolygus lucorum TaxID=248454 RepID=A0A8S9XGY7_APOLU|nr:hypothetical protein GE061_015998 [Apolygus lucorum]
MVDVTLSLLEGDEVLSNPRLDGITTEDASKGGDLLEHRIFLDELPSLVQRTTWTPSYEILMLNIEHGTSQNTSQPVDISGTRAIVLVEA